MSRKVALVTGGSRGIGLGIARQLANQGFDLAINGMRSEEQVAGVLDELRELGAKVIYVPGDIGSAEARASMVGAVRDAFGQLNWLVEQKGADSGFSGGIINVSSISATVVSTNRGEYCIAKAGLSMATQLFAARLGEYDLPVYEVRPGVTKTDMTSGVTEKYDKLIADGLCHPSMWFSGRCWQGCGGAHGQRIPVFHRSSHYGGRRFDHSPIVGSACLGMTFPFENS
jgi:NAD(P)-dependent dehydrogenase (short-subunit alcohol dehydrogenase family)